MNHKMMNHLQQEHKRSFAKTYRDKNLDGRDDINGFNKLPRDMTPPESRDAFSNLIADGRFLNGNGLIISEGIRASSGRISSINNFTDVHRL